MCGITVCTVSSNVLASSGGEQFSLIGQSNIFFDGGSGALTGEHNGIPYEIIQGYAVAQGDMVLGKVSPNGQLVVPAQQRGLGQNSVFERWPDGVIPYQFSDSVSQLQRDRAMLAIAHWNSHTKIQMIPRDESNAANFENYVSFELSGGCASYVGMRGGEQSVWLADNCTVGSIIHEIGHAIGLFHEHTRPDRDNYVTINLSNVSTGKEINFDKIEVGADTYSEYDYGSIMHYGEYFFSSNGQRSISAPDQVNIGQRDALSAKDIDSVNKMYATDLKLAVSAQAKEKTTQLDLVVTNTGNLGAFALVLSASWGENTDWVSFSDGGGWVCQKSAANVRCTRPSMSAFSDSSLSMQALPNGADVSTLKIRVESRTLDTDLTNNVFNDTISTPVEVAQSTQLGTENTNGTITQQTNQGNNNAPNIDTTDTTANNGTALSPPETGAAQGGGGGGAAFYLFALLMGARLNRKSNP